jgi:hypothetical protein
MKSIYYPGPYKVGEKQDGTSFIPIYGVLADNNGLLESSIGYEDSTRQWYAGVEDNDVPGSPLNWIRAGTYQGGSGSDDYNMPSKPYDPDQAYEKIVNGTWAPYLLCADAIQSNVGPANELLSKQSMELSELASVDIILTPDKTQWTRANVIEMGYDPEFTQGNVERFKNRAAPSVDKDGNPADPDSEPSDNPNDPNYISSTGMGWFPGYAINIETGERLNIMFGEDSQLKSYNGADMLFNPTADVFDLVSGEPVFGGKHYIYIMDHRTRNLGDSIYNFPAYDAGRFIREGETFYNVPEKLYYLTMYSSSMWVGLPLLNPEEEWLSNEAKIRIRVAKPYEKYFSVPMDSAAVANSENEQRPLYEFTTEGVVTVEYDQQKAESDLDLISVVPNPYYAYAGGPGYENNALDTRVKITNLPEVCTITIYNVSGTLIRQYSKDETKTSVDWDLKNFAGVPIAGGVYIIHVKSDEGERVIKWFGGLRPPDLNVF